MIEDGGFGLWSDKSISDGDVSYIIFRLHGIKYNGDLWIVDWKKGILEQKKFDKDPRFHGRTQKEWLEKTNNPDWIQVYDNWQLPDGPLYEAIVEALYDNQNHPDPTQNRLIRDMRHMFFTDMDPSFMTSTRSEEIKPGRFKVTHRWGYDNAWSVEVDVKPRDRHGYIDSSRYFQELTSALLDTTDPDKVSRVYEWVSGRKPCFNWAEKTMPTGSLTMGGTGNGRFDIDFIQYGRPAHGVMLRRMSEFDSRE
jgi:hypothetical protein